MQRKRSNLDLVLNELVEFIENNPHHSDLMNAWVNEIRHIVDRM